MVDPLISWLTEEDAGTPRAGPGLSSFSRGETKGMDAMNRATNNEEIAAPRKLEVTERYKPQATVLVATNDPETRESIAELLQLFPLKTVWAKGLEEVKSALTSESVTACLCGFWLVDGTYRDVVRHLKLQPVEIPAILVCAPSCPHEYRDYLAALNIRAFDFICHPYRKTDIERMLLSAIYAHDGSARLRALSSAHSIPAPSVSGLRRAS
jgi:CheY-like chemotaxis protein